MSSFRSKKKAFLGMNGVAMSLRASFEADKRLINRSEETKTSDTLILQFSVISIPVYTTRTFGACLDLEVVCERDGQGAGGLDLYAIIPSVHVRRRAVLQ